MIGTTVSPTVDESEFGYGQLLSILLRRFIWVGGSIVGALGIAIFLTLKAESVYEGSMQLLVEPHYRQTVDLNEDQTNPPSSSPADYATQLNLMRSSTFVEKTIEELLLDDSGICSGSATQAQCIEKFQHALTLSQITEGRTQTGIFKAKFTATTPEEVQKFLKTLGIIYLRYNQEQQEQRLKQGLALVDQQIEQVQGNLTLSRQELQKFRESEHLINPEQQALSAADSLKQVEQTKIDVDSQYLEARAEYDALQDQLKADPESALISSRLSQSSRYQQLLNELQETELALEERLALYAEADPGVQDLKSQKDGKLNLLKEEVGRVLGGTPAQLNLDEASLLKEGQLSQIDLALVSELVQAQVRAQSLSAKQAGLEQASQELKSRLNEFPNLIAEYERIKPETEIQEQSLEQLLQLRQELSNGLAQGGFRWNIVEAPQLGKKISPQPIQNILLGLVAGTFVGGALAFGREAIDGVVRTSDELKKQVTLPLLGVIPEMAIGKGDIIPSILSTERSATDVFSLSEWQPFRDAVDLIHKTLQLTGTQPLSSLMITSALAEEGKTTLSVGLALSAARAQQRVLLIDANLRRPSLHQYFGLSNDQGLSTQLHAQPNRSKQLRVSPISFSLLGSTIDVLPAGPVSDDPVRLLNSRQMQQLLEMAEASYDLVIVDAPAILGIADSLQLASLCKGSVMVSRLDRITQNDLNHAITALNQVNTIGIVANGHRGGAGVDKLYERGSIMDHNGSVAVSTGGPESARSNMFNWTREESQKQGFILPSVGLGMMAVPALCGYSNPQKTPQLFEEPPQLEEKQYQEISNHPSTERDQLCDLAVASVGSRSKSMRIPQWSHSA